MEEQLFITQATEYQKNFKKSISSLLDNTPLEEFKLAINKLEKNGFFLVPSKNNLESYSVLMPSGKVLNYFENKELLNNINLSQVESEINEACMYFGCYLGLCLNALSN